MLVCVALTKHVYMSMLYDIIVQFLFFALQEKSSNIVFSQIHYNNDKDCNDNLVRLLLKIECLMS